MRIFEKVYLIVKKIPSGKVATYGEIAKILGINPRIIGWALHANRDPQVPCHRVVNKEGKMAENYAFGGGSNQKKRLREEKVQFIGDFRVDLNISRFVF